MNVFQSVGKFNCLVGSSSSLEKQEQITLLLLAWRNNRDAEAFHQLIPLVYQELHLIARRLVYRQGANGTLQATALVREAYLQLVDESRVDWQDRSHFFAIAAKAMRRILVDYWRSSQAQIRGGGMVQVPLSDQEGPQIHPNEDVLALHEALEALAVCDERQAQILEMRFFGGMTVDEVAAALSLSRTTIEREERMAKWWLRKKLS